MVIGLHSLVVRRSFYIGLVTLFAGIRLNFFSQTYLRKYVSHGRSLPALSDLILDNIPYWDVDFLYDYFSIVSVLIFIAYVVHKNQYHRIPYVLLLCGMFHLVRRMFIILTPLGHPAMFDGTEGLFNGFSKFELGVYPSGHTGISFIYVLMTRDRVYKGLILFSLCVIIASLFISRGHYSIDVLSGIFFAYAIKSFADKHIQPRFI
ncbi:MAG: phosphatase PAP2-related protein [Fidelibacterota bacterium]